MKTNNDYPLYNVPEISNLKELVAYVADAYSDQPAFIYQREKQTISVSYSRFKYDIDMLGLAFLENGLHGAKIALLGENSYEWVVTYLAVVNSGNVIVPIDKELTAVEIRSLIDHSGSDAIVYSDSYADIAAGLLEDGAAIRHYFNMQQIPALVDLGSRLVDDREASVSGEDIDENALAALMYTSGTMGDPKGVMLSHRNLACNAVADCKNVLFPDSSLLVLPLHHSAGFMGVLGMLIYGSAITINSSLKNLVSDFGECMPGIVVLVPQIIETLYRQTRALATSTTAKNPIAAARLVFGEKLSVILSGGAHLEGSLVEGYLDFGITVLNGYGLTECAALISINRNHDFLPASVGRVVPCCEVMISHPDEAGHGEICVRGDNVMLGYYKDEEATRQAFDGEWLKTGDLGYLDADGFLFVTGRKKNLIILSNGKNVSAEELETAIQRALPYVLEVVVFGVDDSIVAEVYLDPNVSDAPTRLPADMIKLNRSLASFKNIDRTVVRETEFPKTTTKKIRRG